MKFTDEQVTAAGLPAGSADILNQAIVAGLVSPAVWLKRSHLDLSLCGGRDTPHFWRTKEAADRFDGPYTTEQYWGQDR